MRVAVCISGQSRGRSGYEAIVGHFSKFQPTYFLHTWDEQPFAQWAVDAFKPSSYKIDSPEVFVGLKQEFWNKYKKFQPDANILKDRYDILIGKKYGRKYNTPIAYDPTLRMFISMWKASLLAQAYGKFDYVIRCRPDADLRFGFNVDFTKMQSNQVGCDSRHIFGGEDSNGQTYIMSDQCLWGHASVMFPIMDFWPNMPEFIATVDDKCYGRVSHNASWLHPETTLRSYSVLACGAEIVGDPNIRVRVHRHGLPGDPEGAEWRIRPRPPSVPVIE